MTICLASGHSETLCNNSDYAGLCDGSYTGTDIWLPRLSLSGTIPSELALLSATLLSLQIHVNDISGTLPTEMGLLTPIYGARFVVSDNKLSGSVPTELGQLTNIGESFLVGGNRLSGTIPQELTSLNPTHCAIMCSQHAWCQGPDTNQFACPLPTWSSNSPCSTGLSCVWYPPSPPSPPADQQDGAVIEMTGDDPKLIFGTIEKPICQLSIDRPNSRLVSTCSIQDSRRLEEAFDCEGKYAALEQKHKALQIEVSELRSLAEELKAAKME